jgi:hypothetical protein
MRKFMLAAAVVAVAACGEKAADEAMPETETPAETMAPAATEAAPMTDSTTMATPDSTTAAPAAAAPTN